MWTVLFRGLCVARKLFHNDPSAEALMTARGRTDLQVALSKQQPGSEQTEAKREEF